MAAVMCPVCSRKGVRRSGLGTCGSRHCLKVMQGWALYGRENKDGDKVKDGRDPAVGKRVKDPGGKEVIVARSRTVKGTECYVLKDGTTVPMNRCTEL